MFDIKGLVNSLFRPAAQEGVFDLKSATLFMDELPDSDILQAQIEIVKALYPLKGKSINEVTRVEVQNFKEE